MNAFLHESDAVEWQQSDLAATLGSSKALCTRCFVSLI
jgi:hypothetical protein